MDRSIVTCPRCDLKFLTGRPKTFCPGCHQVVEPKKESAA